MGNNSAHLTPVQLLIKGRTYIGIKNLHARLFFWLNNCKKANPPLTTENWLVDDSFIFLKLVEEFNTKVAFKTLKSIICSFLRWNYHHSSVSSLCLAKNSKNELCGCTVTACCIFTGWKADKLHIWKKGI